MSTRVVVVHDYLTQRGGAERVVLAMLRAFPDAPVLTSVYAPDRTFEEFRGHDVRTTRLQRVPAFRDDPRRALPLLASSFSRSFGAELTNADVLLCSSSGWSHGVVTERPKVVYCHNPARWLHQRTEYSDGLPTWKRAVLRGLQPVLSRWDVRAALRAARYLANSSVVAERIRRVYGVEPHILPPPVAIDPAGPQAPVPGLAPGYLLAVARPRSYKNTIAACWAAELAGVRLVVVGGLPPSTSEWSSNLVGLTDVSDATLRWLYANCSGLVAVSHEDFGLTPLEANAFGKPALALRAGGYLDTVVEGRSGVFVEAATPKDIATGIERLRTVRFDEAVVQRHADAFGLDRFVTELRQHVHEVAGQARPSEPVS